MARAGEAEFDAADAGEEAGHGQRVAVRRHDKNVAECFRLGKLGGAVARSGVPSAHRDAAIACWCLIGRGRTCRTPEPEIHVVMFKIGGRCDGFLRLGSGRPFSVPRGPPRAGSRNQCTDSILLEFARMI
jgi:hypothetical protein